MRNLIKITPIVFIFSFLSFCSRERAETVMPNAIEINKNQKSLVIADNSLGFNLYKNIVSTAKQNILLSPLGLNKPISIIALGTKNNYELKRLLNLQNNKNNDFLTEVDKLNSTIFQLDGLCDFSISNSLVLNDPNSLKKHFEKKFQYEDKKPKNNNTGFQTVRSETLSTKSFEVQNDIYLKCSFKHQTGISEAPFYLNPHESKFVEMIICESAFNYYSDNFFKAVEIPIGRGNFVALVILPETGQTIESIKNKFSKHYLQVVNNRFRKLNLLIYIPKLDINYDFSLINDIKKNASTRAFDKHMVFEGFSNKKLYLNDFLQRAKLKTISKPVAKKEVYSGTQSNSFFIDRPFLLLITEKYSGSVVFMGQIVNPVIN